LSASTFTFFPAGGVTTLDVEFLLVGGGGGGGNRNDAGGGGGGAGGFVTGSGIIGKDTYTVKVGAVVLVLRLASDTVEKTVRLVLLLVPLMVAVAAAALEVKSVVQRRRCAQQRTNGGATGVQVKATTVAATHLR
jgi:hypothetical protein